MKVAHFFFLVSYDILALGAQDMSFLTQQKLIWRKPKPQSDETKPMAYLARSTKNVNIKKIKWMTSRRFWVKDNVGLHRPGREAFGGGGGVEHRACLLVIY